VIIVWCFLFDFSVRNDPQKPDRDVKGGHKGALREWVSIHLALDILIKAFVSLLQKIKNCHASISDPRCFGVTVSTSGGF
jgi:hypothetical protein